MPAAIVAVGIRPFSRIRWLFAIKPGLAYSLSDKVNLVAYVGYGGWQFVKQSDVKTNIWECGVSGNNISFGVYVKI